MEHNEIVAANLEEVCERSKSSRPRMKKSHLAAIVICSLLIGGCLGWFGRDIFLAIAWAPVEGLPFELSLPESTRYSNARFDFTISYPSRLLFPQGEADSGDGQLFLSKDATVRLIVYGSYNVTDDTLESAFDAESRGGLSDNPNKVVVYKKLGENWFVVYGYKKGTIFYIKRYLVGDTFAGFEISYPEAQRAIWDKVVMQLNAGFMPEKPSS